MNRKMSKRQRDIKSKLMAAICMLLVSSIMMVSTTYAWFTLSTAPEVTGISTAVGANGNLEMALLPTDALTKGAVQDYGIKSEAGDSMAQQAANLANVTWGNLVDLAYSADGTTNFYGLDKITLYPAALNFGTEDDKGNPTSLADLILKTPTYGSDGRVAELLANTVTGVYDTGEGNFPQKMQTTDMGVRAVGTASGMTDRQLAYRNARSTANTAMAQAKTLATQSLNTNGSALADIALAHGVNASATHTAEDVDALEAIVADLLGDADTTGILGHIENAYRNQIIALAASEASVTAGLNDEQFKVFQAAVNGAADVYDVVDMFETGGDYENAAIDLPASITGPVAALKLTKQNVTEAQEDLAAITDTTGIAWGTISTPLYKLADTDAMKINGYAASTVKQNMSAIVNSVASQGLNVVIGSGGGVYADIADHCGDYSAAITIQKVEYGTLVLENMNAKMATASNVNPAHLSVLDTAIVAAKAPESAGGQIMPISDYYGFIVDLAFRTNAAESNLLLEVEGKNRIYAEDGSEETMGHGSKMTFTTLSSAFTVDQMKSLMKAIRVVFFNPETKTVYATAMLDADNGTVTGGNTVEAEMFLYKLTEQGDISYVQIAYNGEDPLDEYYVQAVSYAQVDEPDKATVQLYIRNADGTYSEAEYKAPTEGQTAPTYYSRVVTYVAATAEQLNTETLYQKIVSTGGETPVGDTVITALTQNEATLVSALVYLDGNKVGNEDVAATAAKSMTGTMNLQFASSAALVPMEYTPLMAQEGSGTGTTTTYTVKESADSDGPATLSNTNYNAETKEITFKVSGEHATGYTVTQNGSTLTPNAEGVYTIQNVTADVEVKITANP